MGIEPLGSMMSMQAQSAAAQKPTAAERAESAAGTMQQAERTDRTVLTVENAQSKGQNGQNSEKNQEPANTEQIRRAVEQLNKKMSHSEAVFGIHEGTNRVMIKIIDKDTKETIRELPPEKTLDMIAKVWELAGILIDERR